MIRALLCLMQGITLPSTLDYYILPGKATAAAPYHKNKLPALLSGEPFDFILNRSGS
jgi:hypothetical protein